MPQPTTPVQTIQDDDADPRIVLEQVLTEALKQQPETELAGCLTVEPYVMPYALSTMRPSCAYVPPEKGEHQISGPWVIRNVVNGEVYCRMECAAKDAIALAVSIAKDEAVYPGV